VVVPSASEIQHVEFRRVLRASAAEVFACLTEADRLRAWFAEHVEVEARVNGAYRFWGRHTPFVATRERADQRLTRFEAGRALRYSWAWAGAETEVLIEIGCADVAGGGAGVSRGAPVGGAGTRLWVRHSLMDGTLGGYPRGESKFFVEDFWGVSLGNLRAYLNDGRAALRPDFSEPGETASVSIEIEAPIERVWRALTDPAEMDKWLSTSAVSEVRVGGAYSYGWKFDGVECGPRRILEVEPPTRLVHDWAFTPGSPTRTEWRLEAVSTGRTRVTIRQMGITKARDHTGDTGGWAKFALALKELVEG